jgi:hypothetical protein
LATEFHYSQEKSDLISNEVRSLFLFIYFVLLSMPRRAYH